MSVDQIGDKEFARRNLWEATLLDENHNPLIWSTGLIKSTNIPKLSFSVEDILAGTSKGYTGWKLPDNLQLSIWETSDHMVEKYLDEWMLGATGVFNPEVGAFRVQPSEDYIYRDVRIKTFIYEFSESTPYQVKKKDVISALSLVMKEGLTEHVGAVSIEQQQYIQAASEIAITEMEKIIANKTLHTFTNQREHSPFQKVPIIEKKQVIPVLDKLTAAVGGLANQIVAHIPILPSDITRRIIPPVVIPPPLLKIPVSTGTPTPPLIDKLYIRSVTLQDQIAPETKERELMLRQAFDEEHQKVMITLLDGVEKKCEEILVDLAAGEAVNAKEWKASEKTTSLVTYSTAIESYDIGTYDYSTGDGVSYTINLPVRDIKIEYPA